MLGSDSAGTLWVGVPPNHRPRAANRLIGLISSAGTELRVDAAANHFGHGNTETPGATLELAMLPWLELDLNTHHDGITIPS
jgi:hypothetical protein